MQHLLLVQHQVKEDDDTLVFDVLVRHTLTIFTPRQPYTRPPKLMMQIVDRLCTHTSKLAGGFRVSMRAAHRGGIARASPARTPRISWTISVLVHLKF
jgi:hypothetical protein